MHERHNLVQQVKTRITKLPAMSQYRQWLLPHLGVCEGGEEDADDGVLLVWDDEDKVVKGVGRGLGQLLEKKETHHPRQLGFGV